MRFIWLIFLFLSIYWFGRLLFARLECECVRVNVCVNVNVNGEWVCSGVGVFSFETGISMVRTAFYSQVSEDILDFLPNIDPAPKPK